MSGTIPSTNAQLKVAIEVPAQDGAKLKALLPEGAFVSQHEVIPDVPGLGRANVIGAVEVTALISIVWLAEHIYDRYLPAKASGVLLDISGKVPKVIVVDGIPHDFIVVKDATGKATAIAKAEIKSSKRLSELLVDLLKGFIGG
ncbi:hypothetical protein [Rhizobium sp. BK251]|uniref:hypothetical protein n=1 Tax=Rhizobium sp. BK251 TaxID=2512125 RepID=UPI0010471566|nr:hypothetical protein [Rhizobium sp. BK251]TCL74054.1 hypothetical protein EV286_103594 [Rhizobium sp. BK251]